MYCPSCGKETPEKSSFCMHCGTRIETPQKSAITLNENPPVSFSMIACFFEGPVIASTPKRWGFSVTQRLIRERLCFAFRLVDRAGVGTTPAGLVRLKLKVSQDTSAWGGGASTVKKDTSFSIKPEDYTIGHTPPQPLYSQPLYRMYINEPTTWLADASEPRAEIEIWFTPLGSNQTIYKKAYLTLELQE